MKIKINDKVLYDESICESVMIQFLMIMILVKYIRSTKMLSSYIHRKEICIEK